MRSAVCRLSLMTLGLPFLLAACGGEDDGPAAPADFEQASGVSDSTGLSSLSPEQAESVCNAFRTYVDSQVSEAEQKNIGCTVAGLLAASFMAQDDTPNQADCRAAYEECQAAPAEEDGAEEESTDECVLPFEMNDCPATLDELEACAQATAQAYKALAASLSGGCSAVANPDALDSVFRSKEPPQACIYLEERCPSFEGDDEE